MLVDLNALQTLRARNQLRAVELVLNHLRLSVPLIQNAARSDVREDVLVRCVKLRHVKAAGGCLRIEVRQRVVIGDAGVVDAENIDDSVVLAAPDFVGAVKEN